MSPVATSFPIVPQTILVLLTLADITSPLVTLNDANVNPVIPSQVINSNNLSPLPCVIFATSVDGEVNEPKLIILPSERDPTFFTSPFNDNVLANVVSHIPKELILNKLFKPQLEPLTSS